MLSGGLVWEGGVLINMIVKVRSPLSGSGRRFWSLIPDVRIADRGRHVSGRDHGCVCMHVHRNNFRVVFTNSLRDSMSYL